MSSDPTFSFIGPTNPIHSEQNGIFKIRLAQFFHCVCPISIEHTSGSISLRYILIKLSKDQGLYLSLNVFAASPKVRASSICIAESTTKRYICTWFGAKSADAVVSECCFVHNEGKHDDLFLYGRFSVDKCNASNDVTESNMYTLEFTDSTNTMTPKITRCEFIDCTHPSFGAISTGYGINEDHPYSFDRIVMVRVTQSNGYCMYIYHQNDPIQCSHWILKDVTAVQFSNVLQFLTITNGFAQPPIAQFLSELNSEPEKGFFIEDYCVMRTKTSQTKRRKLFLMCLVFNL